METNLDIVDWNELQKFEDSERFGEWRMELEDDPPWILGMDEVGWLNDSARAYLSLADALENISATLPSDQAEFLKRSVRTIICGDDDNTKRDFPCIPDSCYFIALSPETVAEIMVNLRKLDVELIKARLRDHLGKEWNTADCDTIEREIGDYFVQIHTIVKEAATRGWGIIGHMG